MKTLILLIILISLLAYMWFWKLMKKKDARNAYIKNITDLLLICIVHFAFAYIVLNGIELPYVSLGMVLGILCAVITHLCVFLIPFITKTGQTDAMAKIMIIEILYQWIFFSFLNLCVYIFDNSSYVFDPIIQGMSWHETAFGFIYYVFCNAIMYEGSGITPVSIPAKVLHIANIIIFVFILVNWLNSWYSEKIKYEKQ